MRLIDADAFEKNMQNEWERNEISNGEWIHFREMINEEPTIEERNNGKWYREVLCSTSGYGTMVMYQCSNCENLAISDYCFCPNCGADMRGGENDGE